VDVSDYSSFTSDSVDTVRIPGHYRCNGCFFSIGVFGYERSAFSVLVTSNVSLIQLQDGLALRGIVQQSQYDYFKFNVQEAGVEIVIVLTTLAGDADLLVSQSDERPTRGSGAMEAGSSGLMEDIITIDASSVVPGDYFIGVFGYVNSQYTIMAHIVNSIHGDNLIRLRPGAPQAGRVEARKFDYYLFSIGNFDKRLVITASPSIGSLSIYVNTCTGSVDTCSGRDGGRVHYIYIYIDLCCESYVS
jgi:hypothetical protein